MQWLFQYLSYCKLASVFQISKFQDYGDVTALGWSRNDPKLILIDVDGRMDRTPPSFITNDYER